MKYKLLKTCKITGAKIFKPYVFKDFRGFFIENYNQKEFLKYINFKSIQNCFSFSKKNVLRGFHAEPHQDKIVSCVYGKILLVLLNIKKKSVNYLKFTKILLNHKNYNLIYIPRNTGIAHLILSKEAIFNYCVNGYYSNKDQKTILWNDKKIKIKWPIKKPILSKRDKVGFY
jgi:dTDP-4-dehydrorhamnose 3,5-epimerase